jgi:hypothetical protein
MNDAPFGNDPAKVERYRAFWNRTPVDRPLVAFTFKTWFPMREYATSLGWENEGIEYLTPDMVDAQSFAADEERILAEGERTGDDIFRGAAPAHAVCWLEAMLGSEQRILPGSILAEERSLSWNELEEIRLDPGNPWYKKYMEFADVLVDQSAGRYPVAHGMLPGPSDLAGSLRGHTQSIVDLMESPEQAVKVLWQMAEIFREITDAVWERLPRFHGGYFDAQYMLWSPGPIIRMQEDATALYSPGMYKKHLQPIDRDIAKRYSHCFMHLHSTSMFILDLMLEIEELGCFEVNNDIAGPPLEEMLPYFQMIQEANRSLLIRGSFSPEELRFLTDHLYARGLYLFIMVESMEEIDTLKPILGM